MKARVIIYYYYHRYNEAESIIAYHQTQKLNIKLP
jgi:hypothetical protein